MEFLIQESQRDAAAELEAKMTVFYTSTSDYTAFKQESNCTDLWAKVKDLIQEKSSTQVNIKILEIGSGMSGFHNVLMQLDKATREKVSYTAQDITNTNFEHLKNKADRCLLGVNPLEITGESFDIIFHSFVFEHVCAPTRTLEHLIALLSRGGTMLFSCPNYGFPFYFSPSVRHRTIWERLSSNFTIVVNGTFSRNQAILNRDPAIFHIPFRRDEDAVHLVSKRQVVKVLSSHGHCQEFKPKVRGIKDLIVKRLLQCHLELKKGHVF